jgi:hypothetical protein
MAAFDPHAAARAGDIEGLRAFLKSGRSADETDEWGNTAMHVRLSRHQILCCNKSLDSMLACICLVPYCRQQQWLDVETLFKSWSMQALL